MSKTQHSNPLEELGETELLQLCRQGNETAFEALYQRMRLPLFAYLHRLLPGRADQADELFQQTWVKFVQNLDRYTDQQKLLAWLCRIAHNLAMDFFRSRKFLTDAELPESYAAKSRSPDEILAREQREAALANAIRELPSDQREIIELRSQGISFKEIAARKGVPLNTALGRMHYAVQTLRKKLSEFL